MRPWAAAHPLAVRAASFARRVVSKPGQAPPPPTGTAARPRRPRGGLQSGGAGNDPAAREARRPHFVRRRASKPARALRSLRHPPHQWGLVCPWAAALPLGRAAWCARWAGLLGVPVGGGPPARSPHASLRLGVVDLEARPGPAATHRHRDQALQQLAHQQHGYTSGLSTGTFHVGQLSTGRWFCLDHALSRA